MRRPERRLAAARLPDDADRRAARHVQGDAGDGADRPTWRCSRPLRTGKSFVRSVTSSIGAASSPGGVASGSLGGPARTCRVGGRPRARSWAGGLAGVPMLAGVPVLTLLAGAFALVSPSELVLSSGADPASELVSVSGLVSASGPPRPTPDDVNGTKQAKPCAPSPGSGGRSPCRCGMGACRARAARTGSPAAGRTGRAAGRGWCTAAHRPGGPVGQGVEQCDRIRVPGVREHLIRAGGLGDPPRVHHRDPVGVARDHAEVVGDQDDRHTQPFAQVVDQLEDLLLDRDVERGGRLVGDEQLGLAGQRHRDHDALPHARRRAGAGTSSDALAGLRHADPGEHLDRPVGRLGAADRPRCSRTARRSGRRRSGRVQRGQRVLEDDPDLVAPHRPDRRARAADQVRRRRTGSGRR